MTGAVPDAKKGTEPLAIICGGGSLPYVVARAARQQGRRVVLFLLRGSASPDGLNDFDHHWVDMGRFGLFRRVMDSIGCREVVLIGSVIRPAMKDLRLDMYTLRLMPKIVRAFRSGDDYLLSSVATIMEEHGYRVIGAHEIAPEILMPPGLMTGTRPSESDWSDIAVALKLLDATGPFDVGQAAVVCDGRVLAIEAAEGTDEMLARLADLRQRGRIRARAGGVMVKAPKATQDRRLDLPSVGPASVSGATNAGLAGIAVLAGGAVIAEPDKVAAAADRAGLFVVGVSADGRLA